MTAAAAAAAAAAAVAAVAVAVETTGSSFRPLPFCILRDCELKLPCPSATFTWWG